jgi:hypothetical protein
MQRAKGIDRNGGDDQMKKKPNPKVVRDAILEVVDNQLREDTPPETVILYRIKRAAIAPDIKLLTQHSN